MIKGAKHENEYLHRQIETLRRVTVSQRDDAAKVQPQMPQQPSLVDYARAVPESEELRLAKFELEQLRSTALLKTEEAKNLAKQLESQKRRIQAEAKKQQDCLQTQVQSLTQRIQEKTCDIERKNAMIEEL